MSSLIVFVAVAVAARTGAPDGSNALISSNREYSGLKEPLLQKIKLNVHVSFVSG